MDGAFGDVLAMSEAKSVDLRGAAMMVAVDRVAGATSLRGLSLRMTDRERWRRAPGRDGRRSA